MTPDSLKRFLVMVVAVIANLSAMFLKVEIPPEVQQAVVISIGFIVSTYLYQSGKKSAEKMRIDGLRGGITDAELIAAAEKLRANPVVKTPSIP